MGGVTGLVYWMWAGLLVWYPGCGRDYWSILDVGGVTGASWMWAGLLVLSGILCD